MENKKSKNIDIIKIILIIVGGVLLISGLLYSVTSRVFSFSSIEEYVGGDAYNAIIESSIRGGEIAGAMICKTLYICTGVITMALGLLKNKSNNLSNDEN